MYEDEDQGFMLLVLGVLAAVLMTVLWYVVSADDSAVAGSAASAAVGAGALVDADGDAAAGIPDAEAADLDAADADADTAGDADADADVDAGDADTAGDADADAGPDADADADGEAAAPAPTAMPEPDPEAAPVAGADTGATNGEPLELVVTAEDGGVVLMGTVSSEALREGVASDAARLVGADNVTNLLEVDETRSIANGWNTELYGTVGSETEASALRTLAGVGVKEVRNEVDQLTVLTPTEIPATPEPVGPTVAERLTSLFAFNPITFDSGSSVIAGSSFGPLDEAAAVLSANPDAALRVEGHTDSQGDPGRNLTLSQQRADAVVAYLVSQGASADQLTAEGFGADNPVADNATAEGRAENRRIEFIQLN